MARIIEGSLSAQGLRFAMVVSRFNSFIGDRLCDGALDALRRSGAREDDVTIVRTPGAFEIPGVAKLLAESGDHDAVICLGAVIRGATPHFDHVAGQAARGVAEASLSTGIPVVFGVLTTDTIEQAVERAGTKGGNKGFDAATAAIELAHVYRALGKVRGRSRSEGGKPAV